jgi:hypothetical protein
MLMSSLAASAAGVLVGCGGSGGTSTSAGPTIAPAQVSTGTNAGKARAVAYASAVNLRPADLPKMNVVAPEHEAPAPSANGLALDRCYGDVGHAIHVAKVDSAKFASVTGREHVEIWSNVEVMPTAALAAKNNAANAGPLAFSCAKRFLPQTLARVSGPRVRFGALTITRIPVSLPGGYGASITARILGVPAAIEPVQPRLYTDALAFLAGRAEVALLTVAFPRPASAAMESALLALLYGRARATRL